MLFLLAFTIVPSCTTVDVESIPEIVSFAAPDKHCFDSDRDILKVMTLNIGDWLGSHFADFLQNGIPLRRSEDV